MEQFTLFDPRRPNRIAWLAYFCIGFSIAVFFAFAIFWVAVRFFSVDLFSGWPILVTGEPLDREVFAYPGFFQRMLLISFLPLFLLAMYRFVSNGWLPIQFFFNFGVGGYFNDENRVRQDMKLSLKNIKVGRKMRAAWIICSLIPLLIFILSCI